MPKLFLAFFPEWFTAEEQSVIFTADSQSLTSEALAIQGIRTAAPKK
jgi:hypothetical protein